MWWAIRAGCRRSAAGFALALAAGLAAAGAAPFPSVPARAAQADYVRIFGRHYASALEFAARHAAADDVFRAWDIPAAFAWAVVFPELIRYSALADAIETADLEVLYVQFGKHYGNSSVGRFQMQPAFAETLEGDFLRLADAGDRARLGPAPFDRADTVKARRARAGRLTDLAGQARYLAMFIRVMDKLYAGETWDGTEAKLRFYATAYNAGYRLGAARIRKESAIARFPTGLFAGKDVYIYADIAADLWRVMTAKEGSR